MSQCIAEDQDFVQKFPTTIYRTPKFPEEPSAIVRVLKGRHLKKATKPTNRTKVVEDLQRQLDTTVFRLLVTAHSRNEFSSLRDELFPDFVEISGVISTLLRTKTDRIAHVFELLREVFVADAWLLPNHEGAKDEVIFCLDSLHRAHFLALDVLEYVHRSELPREALKGFQSAISQEWWSLLHLRCLTFSISHRLMPTNEVFCCVLEGLRHSVMAYAFAREAMEQKYKGDYRKIDFESIAESVEREALVT